MLMRFLQGALIVSFGAAYSGLVNWYPDIIWLDSLLWSMAWPVTISVIALMGVVFARMLNHRDPSLFGWAVLSIAGCLLIAPLMLAKQQQGAYDQRRSEALLAAREEVMADMRKREQAIIEAERERRANAPRDRFTQYEGRVDAISLQAIRVLDEQMQAQVKEQAEAYQLAMETYPVLGPSAWATFGSKSQLEEERTSHQRLYETTRAYNQFIESFEERYTEGIEAIGLKPPADRIAIAEMERVLQSWEANRTIDLRKLDVEILGAALNALNVLDEAWGQWSYNPREQRLSFENQGTERRFQEAMQRLQFAYAAVKEIRENENSPEN